MNYRDEKTISWPDEKPKNELPSRQVERHVRQQPCEWCDKGDLPHLLDQDGVRCSVSGDTGTYCHAYEDSWWQCERLVHLKLVAA